MTMLSIPHTRSIALLAFIALTLPLGSLRAQTAPAPEKRIQFRVMSMSGVIRDIAFLQGREPVEFNASHSGPTAWMEYRGSGPLYFFKADDLKNLAALQQNEERPLPMAQFDPPSSGEWLLLFVADTSAGASGQFRVVPVPEDNDAITEGIRFYNLTREPLAIGINNEQFMLEAGSRRHVNPEPGPNNAMGMKIGARGPSGWKVVSSTVFGHRPNARITYYIIRTGTGVRTKRFVDPVPRQVGPS